MKKPRICASIISNDPESIREVELFVDLFEVRIDLIGSGWQEVAKQIKKPWIACNRSADEGGRGDRDEDRRIEELLKAMELGADIVDIELRTKSKAVPLIKKKAKCLLSFHDLVGTPPLDEMRRIVQSELDAGADICKVVTTARSFEDNLIILQLVSGFSEKRIVSFAMGQLGSVSRMLCPLAGGDFTYASIREGKESAPGQITARELRELYKITHANKPISGETKICGLIGDPVGHTMSPAMHNAAFEKLGLDYVYFPLRVRQEELGATVKGMKALKIRGFNVTIPHKVAVIPFLDELDSLAEKIGAVNTIVNDSGFLKGYNTDAAGFLQALFEKHIEPVGKNVVVLGAGGASRAVSFALAGRGAHLVILNRRLEMDWAEALAAKISAVFQKKVEAVELVEANLARVLEKADILVNATSVGMSPGIDETPVNSRLLKPALVVVDIVYNPVKTRLLKEAEQVGAATISGLDMLVWQGALAFKLWTGQEALVGLMKETVSRGLQEYEK